MMHPHSYELFNTTLLYFYLLLCSRYYIRFT